MVRSFSFDSLLFSFILFSSLWTKTVLKRLNSKRKSRRKILKKLWKKCENVEKCQKVWKSAKTILPFRYCPPVFLWQLGGQTQARKSTISLFALTLQGRDIRALVPSPPPINLWGENHRHEWLCLLFQENHMDWGGRNKCSSRHRYKDCISQLSQLGLKHVDLSGVAAKGQFWQTRVHWLAGSFACPHPTPHPPHPLALFPHFPQEDHLPHRNSHPIAKTPPKGPFRT